MNFPDIWNVDSLRAALRSGRSFEYCLFWGHRPRFKGSVDASCLSQWFPLRFVVDDRIYPTAEHFMMAEKARLFCDRHTESAILSCTNPGKAKKLGRQIQGFEHSVWAEHRSEIVVRANVAKFSQNPKYQSFLQATGSQVLVESSPDDQIWGTGLHRDHEDARRPEKWTGQNLLGFALMKVRDLCQVGE